MIDHPGSRLTIRVGSEASKASRRSGIRVKSSTSSAYHIRDSVASEPDPEIKRDKASRTLDLMKEEENEEVVVREVQLHTSRKRGKSDRSRAASAFRRLTTWPSPSDRPLQTAAEALAKARWDKEIDQAVDAVLEDPSAHPYVGELWANGQRLDRRRWLRLRDRLDRLLQQGAIGQRALDLLVCRTGEAKKLSLLTNLVKHYRARLKTNDRSWGMVGYALYAAGDFAGAKHWMADWKRRPQVERWMLSNLEFALRAQGDDAAADRVSRYALTLPADQTEAIPA